MNKDNIDSVGTDRHLSAGAGKYTSVVWRYHIYNMTGSEGIGDALGDISSQLSSRE